LSAPTTGSPNTELLQATLEVWIWVTYFDVSPYLTFRVPVNLQVCPSFAQTCQLMARLPAASCSVSSIDIT
jgi:hypothetical protein